LLKYIVLCCTVFNCIYFRPKLLKVMSFYRLFFINYSSLRWFFTIALKKYLLFSFVFSLFSLQVAASGTRIQYGLLHSCTTCFHHFSSWLHTMIWLFLIQWMQQLNGSIHVYRQIITLKFSHAARVYFRRKHCCEIM